MLLEEAVELADPLSSSMRRRAPSWLLDASPPRTSDHCASCRARDDGGAGGTRNLRISGDRSTVGIVSSWVTAFTLSDGGGG